jgi:hypothetical protein
MQAWVGHPYFHITDNSTDFEQKLMRMLSVSAIRIDGVELNALCINNKFNEDSRTAKNTLCADCM